MTDSIIITPGTTCVSTLFQDGTGSIKWYDGVVKEMKDGLYTIEYDDGDLEDMYPEEARWAAFHYRSLHTMIVMELAIDELEDILRTPYKSGSTTLKRRVHRWAEDIRDTIDDC